MKRSFIIYLTLLLLFFGCTTPQVVHKKASIIEYTVLWNDSSKNILKQCSRPVPTVNSFFTPNSIQVDTMIKDLKASRMSIQPALPYPIEEYRYQIAGINSSFLYVNSISTHSKEQYSEWLTKPVVACDSGGLNWGIVYDIRKRQFSQLYKNGTKK